MSATKTIRTEKAALAEAQRRWGRSAVVSKNPHQELPYHVGCVVLGMFFEVRGLGKTWNDAFDYADRREAEDRERYRALKSAKAEGGAS